MSARERSGQRLVRRSPFVTRWLGGLLVGAAVLLVVELALANVPESWRGDWPWRVRLLGAPAAASLLVASIVAWVARDQYARSVSPVLRCVSRWTDRTDELAAADRYRTVLVRNAGSGLAVVVDVSWHVARADSPAATVVSGMADLRALLDGLGLRDGVDYGIGNYSSGTALAPGEERHYFECTGAAAERFTVFDAVFVVESPLGDRFEKAMPLLPRPGASAPSPARGAAA